MIFPKTQATSQFTVNKGNGDFLQGEIRDNGGIITSGTTYGMAGTIGIFNQAWTISAIDEFSEDNNHKSFYSDILKKFCSISFIGATILIFIIKPFMKIYVNNSFFTAWSYSVWLIIGAVSSGICSFLDGQ